MKLKNIIIGLVVSLSLVGCVSSPAPKNDKILNVKVISGKTSTPLSIHFFTLKSESVFRRLDYFELVDSKNINWNGELLSRAKTLLLPGHTEIFQVPVTEEMQYYALVIGFKDVRDNDNWRYLKTVPKNGESIALLLSQESDGYSSRVVHKVTNDVQNKNNSSLLGNIGTNISNRANTIGNKSMNNAMDSIFNKVRY